MNALHLSKGQLSANATNGRELSSAKALVGVIAALGVEESVD
jgi:hypothetical protein